MATYTYSYVPQYYYQQPMYYYYDQYNPYKGNLYQMAGIYDGSEGGSNEGLHRALKVAAGVGKVVFKLAKVGIMIGLHFIGG